MKVYVLTEDHKYEYSEIIGVYFKFESARLIAQKIVVDKLTGNISQAVKMFKNQKLKNGVNELLDEAINNAIKSFNSWKYVDGVLTNGTVTYNIVEWEVNE